LQFKENSFRDIEMKRRELFGLMALPLFLNAPISAQPRPASIIKAPTLKEGDRVGIIAPATNVSDPDEINLSLEIMSLLGLEPVLSGLLTDGKGYKTKSIDDRVADIHRMFSDKSINAIFCIRGGYGSGALLDKLDYQLIRSNPKVFIGYSDITAMHLAISKFSGLVTFHGPMPSSRFPKYTFENFKRVMFKKEGWNILKNPDAGSVRELYPIRILNNGTSEGPLVGGNLSLIVSLMGTPFEIDADNKILFIEDVGEEPFRIDRMLNQLRLAGKLDKLKGIVFGACTDCLAKSRIWDPALGEVLDNYLKGRNYPVIYGLMIGHTDEQLILPYGINARLSADNGTIELLESPFSE
jgi:muramoyltetrapeptide carboxypeptidase